MSCHAKANLVPSHTNIDVSPDDVPRKTTELGTGVDMRPSLSRSRGFAFNLPFNGVNWIEAGAFGFARSACERAPTKRARFHPRVPPRSRARRTPESIDYRADRGRSHSDLRSLGMSRRWRIAPR
ncbi:hypothetical protein X777_06128 [Ooceraea biroi]|uniref:Uncharacterized protein n=1 Tax=Ooceraea biroi TaxID=2015173 RepID=A0A026WFP7_OOCBI|nr:hypothetical protein X777_06128 [Ooceraea biroi]